MRLNPNVRISCKRVAILPEHVARFRLQTAPAETTDNCSFDGIGADTRATVQAEAMSPSDLATLVEAALRNGWGQDVADRLAEREGDERERLRRWFNRSPIDRRREHWVMIGPVGASRGRLRAVGRDDGRG